MISLNKIRIGYALSIILLLTSYLLILSTNRRLEVEKENIVAAYRLINKLGAVQMAVSEAETNVREYLLMKNPRTLKGFETSRNSLIQLNADVKKLAENDRKQALNAATLQSLTHSRMNELSAALKLGGAALRQADSIYNHIRLMILLEEPVMKRRMSRLNSFYNSTELMTIISLVMAIIAALYAFLTFNSQYRQKRKANKRATQYHDELKENIKELRDRNAELKELKGVEKLASIGRVARVVAHEVRNPLTNISLATEQLQDLACIKTETDGLFLLKMIERNSSRIGQMVADLLNATKFMQLDKQRADINQVLDESLGMAMDRLVLKKIQVIKSYSPEVCDVMVDKERIQLAFLNIIVNAIEAMQEKTGRLELQTRREADRCIIEIRDNGSGMDENTLQNLFEPYFTMKKKGNGLGLTNTQNIIWNHKGDIKVTSKPGEGSVFTISIGAV